MTPSRKSTSIVGIAWYRPEQWVALKQFSEDRDSMDSTYEIWKRGAQRAMRKLRSQGQQVVPVDFDLEEFKAWCSANRKRPIAASRSAFTVIKLRDTHKL